MLNISKSHGFNGFLRDKKYADNSCCGNTLMHLELQRVKCDIMVQHLPTMPFLTKKTLENSIDAVVVKHDSILAGYEEAFYQWKKDKPEYDINNIPNSYNLEKTFIEGMGLYVVKRSFFESSGVRVGGNFKKIHLNNFERIDINYKEDYEISLAVEKYFGERYE
jgi:CMP-N-acetylneuraminic acid synthetase